MLDDPITKRDLVDAVQTIRDMLIMGLDRERSFNSISNSTARIEKTCASFATRTNNGHSPEENKDNG